MDDLDNDILAIVGKELDADNRRNKTRKIKTIVYLLLSNKIPFQDI
ncbi:MULTISPECIES: hypothetical protein [Snodgrassella]|nr:MULTISPECIES: hypothetical protein [Snodgrassella]SCC04036.1 hypothetical protein GA0061082_1079 [Snodgrassella sp. R-53583]